MSGFNAVKKEENKIEETAEAEPEIPLVEQTIEQVAESSAPTGIAAEIEMAAAEDTGTHIFCGVIGFEGSGKSGIVLDSLTDEQIANGDYILAADFDGGAAACKSAYHRDKSRNNRCLSPWVMATEDRTTYDYPATHARMMEIGRFGVAQAVKQNKEGYTGPRLAKFLVTAVD